MRKAGKVYEKKKKQQKQQRGDRDSAALGAARTALEVSFKAIHPCSRTASKDARQIRNKLPRRAQQELHLYVLPHRSLRHAAMLLQRRAVVPSRVVLIVGSTFQLFAISFFLSLFSARRVIFIEVPFSFVCSLRFGRDKKATP